MIRNSLFSRKYLTFIVMIAVFVQVLVYQIKTKSAQTPLPSFVILSHAHLDFLDLLRF